MTDLSQHAAQLTIWQNYHDICYQFEKQYELNWFTPYLGAFLVTKLFALVLPLYSALKLTIFGCVIALPLSILMVTKRAKVDNWLALLGFPLAFGYSFHWGFLTTILAVPIGIVFICIALEHIQEQTMRRSLLLSGLGVILLSAHALIFVACTAVAISAFFSRLRLPKRPLYAVFPFLVSLSLFFVWQRHVSSDARLQIPPLWDVNLMRIWRFFSYLLAGVTKTTEGVFGLLLFFTAALTGLRPVRKLYRWAPAIVLGLLFFVTPMQLQGVTFVYGRLAVLFAIFLLFGFEQKKSILNPVLTRVILTTVVVSWLCILTLRFAAFGKESTDFERLVDHIPTNRSVLFLTYNRESEAVPGTPYLQWGAYYQVRKGGLISWSFANNFQTIVQYRPGVELRTSKALYLDPRRFTWGSNDSKYEFFVAKSPVDRGAELFRKTTERVILVANIGEWWLYRRASVSMENGPCHELAAGDS